MRKTFMTPVPNLLAFGFLPLTGSAAFQGADPVNYWRYLQQGKRQEKR